MARRWRPDPHTATAGRRSIDVDALRDALRQRVTAADVLSYFAHPCPGARGRIHCPFCEGRRATCSIDGWLWNCFRCGQRGDAIRLARELGGLGFLDALTLLAKLAGVPLGRSTPAAVARIAAERRRLEDTRRARELDHRRHWWRLIHAHDDAERDCFVVAAAQRLDPDCREALTRDIMCRLGSAFARRDELERQLDELEAEWRTWREESQRPRRAA